ncbi:N-acetylmuramidase domain-containing protein [Mesorhizobium sp. YIM 152430]|uniref:N-acetylmuramidase domain-containing protein n=1 Tax=Mesorhizobium sp. YIM 152430 TaxID=3031761 RepID=UPI0023D98FAF|nr:N-acetylmuramidase domain-containing protein [Mesorhizobium sp. YIM 152430]MDF1601707.1 N-acetylmuramidase domain-containing protein [Mesorhizobium sp. YIM 152430]
MLDPEIRTALISVARAFDLDPATLAAVASVESNLVAHAMVDGRREPLIRFEGHYFDRRLSGQAQARARAAGLASPTAGAIRNPASQAARWAMLERARSIDPGAADEATSWGMGQVMGAHWAWLGFASVGALVAEARSGAEGQVRLMARYIEKAGLAGALARRDWPAFARGYNGPGFARNAYDVKLASGHGRYARLDWTGAHTALRRGDRGEKVSELQRRLVAHGATLSVDGVFGSLTQHAVRAFQLRRGLTAHGIADAPTLAALAAPRGPLGRLLETLLSVFARG